MVDMGDFEYEGLDTDDGLVDLFVCGNMMG